MWHEGGYPRIFGHFAAALVLSFFYWTFIVHADSSTSYRISQIAPQGFPVAGADSAGVVCPLGMFKCPEGKCIPHLWVCNYQKDCENGEEEHSCPPPECEPGQISCRQYLFNRTYCIPPHYRCDRAVDCIDGSDETECKYRTCQPDDFHCGSRQTDPCVPKEKKCDGYLDCRSGKDEQGCPGVACQLDQFRCANGQRCIEMTLKCDHKNDCGDNSDEMGCNFPLCNAGQFRCANALCIPNKFRCDGYHDCSDGSDETNCTVISCPENHFLCPKGGPNATSKCIPRNKLCDKKRDCEDGADEEVACSTAECPLLNCQYKCQASLSGGTCYCSDGKKLSSDNRTCVDRDECSEWGYCDQQCLNTQGGYQCSCAPGFNLLNSTKCNAQDADRMRLYFAHDKSIISINGDGKDIRVIINTTAASGLDYHFENNMLFWSDVKTKRIHSQQLHDTSSLIHVPDVDISLPGTWLPVALAVDWIGDKIYVADAVGQKIDVFELRGRWHAIALGSNLTNPTDIALDPTIGYMFVADNSQILRANMDGTNPHAIVDRKSVV